MRQNDKWLNLSDWHREVHCLQFLCLPFLCVSDILVTWLNIEFSLIDQRHTTKTVILKSLHHCVAFVFLFLSIPVFQVIFFFFQTNFFSGGFNFNFAFQSHHIIQTFVGLGLIINYEIKHNITHTHARKKRCY